MWRSVHLVVRGMEGVCCPVDGGVPFDPVKKADPDVTRSAEERAVGGLGIFLVRKTMDKMEYRYDDGTNVLTIYKQI